MLSDIRTRVAIEVAFDLICPWCFLGTRRLQRAVRRRSDLLVEVNWRPFLLNPDMPRGGMSRADYVTRKFGSEERSRRLYGQITELGGAEGVPFRFDRMMRMPSSVDAHRLVRFAARIDGTLAADIVDALFVAHFSDGRDIGDLRVLTAIGAEFGLDIPSVRTLLIGPEMVDEVHGENLRAHRLGINGVPCFVLGDRMAIAGAQEPEVIERLLDVAMLDT
jgi:predicted DsbA family dithiol-disulfide isomerase